MTYNKEKDQRLLRQLLKKAQNGDMEAFNKIYELTAQAQYFHIYQILPDPHEAQDALQETYLLLYKNLQKISPPSALLAYLNRLSYYVSKNLAKCQARREYRTVPILEAEEFPDQKESALDKIQNIEKYKLLKEAISDLPERQRALIIMRYYQKLPMNKIAFSLDISIATAQRLYRSAREQMKAMLEQKGIYAAISFGPEIYAAIDGQIKAASLPTLNSAAQGTSGLSLPEPSLPKAPGGILGGAAVKSALVLTAVSAGAITTIQAAPAPEIISIEEPAEYCAAPAKLSIQVNSSLPVSQVTVKDQNGSLIPAAEEKRNHYTAQIPKNGAYTVTVRSKGGQTTTAKTEVTRIDTVHPSARPIKAEDHKLWVEFTDKESGIDPASLILKSDSGVITRPFSWDKKTSTAVFELTRENQLLQYQDRAGNMAEIPLDFKSGRNQL